MSLTVFFSVGFMPVRATCDVRCVTSSRRTR
jgi:hypothetical protein